MNFDQFLFTSGDSMLWMIVNKTEIYNHVDHGLSGTNGYKPVKYEQGNNAWRGTSGLKERGPELFPNTPGQIIPNEGLNKNHGPAISFQDTNVILRDSVKNVNVFKSTFSGLMC